MIFQEAHMATYDKSAGAGTREPTTKAEFYQIAGITPELEEFINAFWERPDIFRSMSRREKRKIEAQMDSVLSLLCLV
jgi:hypothetical protein